MNHIIIHMYRHNYYYITFSRVKIFLFTKHKHYLVVALIIFEIHVKCIVLEFRTRTQETLILIITQFGIKCTIKFELNLKL